MVMSLTSVISIQKPIVWPFAFTLLLQLILLAETHQYRVRPVVYLDLPSTSANQKKRQMVLYPPVLKNTERALVQIIRIFLRRV
ncbi:hypothetical protein K493DRAFT_312675 [Basidiobolus meristosporus CBS 931.73]|uniref:Uncharacterized protein n=1 Tax=Basidiobolus meristosporus CBS 931.73 TaxID=1314790 RepID=A0A1Y1YRV3_9FUNG|nr:hypothetical protein K493DRAFT_312675 [Basidiobolus meristosporus CBS 931.73]|eukprot:ORY00761.1 hypothetical protein K493DRAFT_312675 [Basidiobolus meristosporus CBS 931.73]